MKIGTYWPVTRFGVEGNKRQRFKKLPFSRDYAVPGTEISTATAILQILKTPFRGIKAWLDSPYNGPVGPLGEFFNRK